MTQDEEHHTLDLYDKNQNKAGSLQITTQYLWQEPDAEPDYEDDIFDETTPPKPQICELLDEKSMLRIIIQEATFRKDSDFFGKQDPYIRFKYNNIDLATEVQDDAGKKAKWNETFQLPNISTSVQNHGTLVFEAFDKDIGSSDFLGRTKPFKIDEHVADDELDNLEVDLFDKKDKKAGSLRLQTQLILVRADPAINTSLNSNCSLEIKLEEATFLKDLDMIGKQDPYIQFDYGKRVFKSKVQGDQGLRAKFDDIFTLKNIQNAIESGQKLVLNAYDEDVGSSELLGSMYPMSYVPMVNNLETMHNIDLFINYKKSGNIKFSTKFLWAKPEPPLNPKMNANSKLSIIIKSATFLKDLDMIGKQDPFATFEFMGTTCSTDVLDGAGKSAVWNQKFCLPNILEAANRGEPLVIETFDKDIASAERLGKTDPVSFLMLTEDEVEKTHDVLLFDAHDKPAGQLIFSS